MRIDVEHKQGICIAVLRCDALDAKTVPDFKQACVDVVAQAQKLAFDLSYVEFIDSCGLGALLSVQKSMRAKAGSIALFNVQSQAQAMFKLVRMDKAFQIYADLTELLSCGD